MLKKIQVGLVIALSICTTTQVWAVGASGLSSQFVGAKAMGQGNAFVAQANDPSAIYFNPAGITQLEGTQISLGSALVMPFTERTGADMPEDKMRRQLSAIPNFYLTGSVGLPSSLGSTDRIHMGVGVTSPYGLTTDWAPTSSMRYVTTLSKFEMVNVNPTVAIKVLPTLSLGVGADYVNLFNTVSQSQTNQALANGDMSEDGTSKMSGHGNGWGYNVGVLYKPVEKHSFGASFRSQVKIPIKGTIELTNLSASSQANYNFAGANYSADANSSIILPASLITGYAFKPTDQWTFLADYEWTQWNTYQNQDVAVSETDPNRLAFITGDGTTNISHTAKNWHNTSSIGLGTNYKANERWQFRGGYEFLQKTVPNDTFTPDVTDAPVHGVTLGVTRNWTRSLALDLGFNGWFFVNRPVDNTLKGPAISGTYKTFMPIIGLNLTYAFGDK